MSASAAGLVYLFFLLTSTQVRCGKGMNAAITMQPALPQPVYNNNIVLSVCCVINASEVPVVVVSSSLAVTEGDAVAVCVIIDRSIPVFFSLSKFPQLLPITLQFLTAGNIS